MSGFCCGFKGSLRQYSVYVVPSLREMEYMIGEINRIYDGVEAEARKSQASFQII